MKKLPVIFSAGFLNGILAPAVQYAIVFSAKQDFSSGSNHVGALGATMNIAYALFCIFGRGIICSLPAVTCLKIGLFGYTAGALILAAAPSLWVLYVGMAITGASTAFYWPPLMGWLSEGYEGKALAKVSGYYNLSWSTANIISPVITGWLCDKSPTLSLWVMTIAYAALFLFILIVCRNVKPPMQSEKKEEAANGFATALRYPAWLGLALSWFCIGYISYVFPYAAEELYGFSRMKIGAFLSIRVVTFTLAVVLLGFVPFWQYKLRWLVISQFMLFITMIGMGYIHNEIFFCAAMASIGLFTGLNYISSQFHGVAGSTNRTLRMSIHEITIASGAISSGFICGFLYQHTSITTVSLVCAGIVGLALITDLIFGLTRHRIKA